MSFVIEPLSAEHDRRRFASGDPTLDRYFKDLVTQDVRRRVAGCFVATTNGRQVAGFYTLAASSVALDDLPADLAKRLPRYPVVPAMLIGRLAVETSLKGQGLGRALVYDACLRTDRLGVGAYAMLVKPKSDEVAAFYRRTGFLSLTGQSELLYLPLEMALQAK